MTKTNTNGPSFRQQVHYVRAGEYEYENGEVQDDDISKHVKNIKPWLSALLQSENLNLLIGNGLTIAASNLVGITPPDMKAVCFNSKYADAINKSAKENAKITYRGECNFEDQIKVVNELLCGLRIMDDECKMETDIRSLEEELNEHLTDFIRKILETEQQIQNALTSQNNQNIRNWQQFNEFLLTFANRAVSRQRLHIFTTNYDRIIEYGCDLLGFHIIDRFVGEVCPVFRSSRLGLDLHYNPPGIRGEPRYVEGVVRLTKLHGSIDWCQSSSATGEKEIRKRNIPFCSGKISFKNSTIMDNNVIIHPNPAKDMETLNYPYADLFRDFAAASCQPNTVVFTYGYGFGDDHINRILRDMLSIPSTHIVIISYDNADGRICRFCESVGRAEQITLLLGEHFGDLQTLSKSYLPRLTLDQITGKMVEIIDQKSLKQVVERQQVQQNQKMEKKNEFNY